MTDEKYLYNQDLREKKSTARSARNKRTHTGKSGRVRFPSDNLTKKELQAMNGKLERYRLNEPMSWKEFKAMPDDIKISYIKALQGKFNVTATALGDMFGVDRITVGKMLNELKIEHRTQGNNKWDKTGFYVWANRKAVEVPTAENASDVEPVIEDVPTEQDKPCGNQAPSTGLLVFDGSAENALQAVATLLGGANAHITVSWELCDNGRS
jgi:hypothetical protein